MERLLVDFNSIAAGDFVTGLREDLENDFNPLVGDLVCLHDGGEHECWGMIDTIDDQLVRARMLRASWRSTCDDQNNVTISQSGLATYSVGTAEQRDLPAHKQSRGSSNRILPA